MRPRRILPLLVAAQFAGTALWFAGNAVLPDLQREWGLDGSATAWTTSAVQLGFIIGTLVAALTGLLDRVSRRRLFFVGSVAGGLVNLIPLAQPGLPTLLVCRALTGVCLAGIYPVGMALAASWYQDGLGRALGWLVGALVLGTAAPHGVRHLGSALPWSTVWVVTSVLAVAGGFAVLLGVPDGPHRRPRSKGRVDLRALFAAPKFRAAAFGYFGHMWELYAMWTFVPALLATRTDAVAGWSFLVIAAGAVGCVVGGVLSRRHGSVRVARFSLVVSGSLALLAPLVIELPWPICIGLLLLWGLTVVADSPQLSTLTAQTAPPALVGTGLAIVTALGFALTIVSIQLLAALEPLGLASVMPILAAGPIIGIWVLRRRGQ
ncbi:MAG: putative MFS family arabinose efflux permease [Myxococcota bacterium]|jgi:predicted MFS family arabinose efflux permease